MGDRLGIPCVLSIFFTFLKLNTWFYRVFSSKSYFPTSDSYSTCSILLEYRIKFLDKKCTFGLPGGLVGVWVPQGCENRNFTHPIFESDFDCLTGKHRILALSLLPLLPPIIQNKNFKIIHVLYITVIFPFK